MARRSIVLAALGLVVCGGVLAWLLTRPAPEPDWSESFDRGDLSQWSQVLRAAPDRLQLVDAPSRDGTGALRLRVADSDVAPATPTRSTTASAPGSAKSWPASSRRGGCPAR